MRHKYLIVIKKQDNDAVNLKSSQLEIWLFWKFSRKQTRGCAWKCFTFRNSILDDFDTLEKFSFSFRSSRLQIIFKIGVLKIS